MNTTLHFKNWMHHHHWFTHHDDAHQSFLHNSRFWIAIATAFAAITLLALALWLAQTGQAGQQDIYFYQYGFPFVP